MKKNLPVIIGIVVFAAVLAGWVYTLPVVFRHLNGDGRLSGVFEEINIEGDHFFSTIKQAQTIMGSGVSEIDAAVTAEYKKQTAIVGLKSKIENKEKIKAALDKIPAPATPIKP